MAPRRSEPRASVVVATYNRHDRLDALVAGLENQQSAGPFEVIVVDDGSSDGTAASLEQLAAKSSLDMRVMRLAENGGPAAARNAGWRAARAPVVCFTDDDCVPQAGWLSALLDGLEDADLVQGRTLPNPEQLHRRGPFSHTIWVFREEGYYETCNIGYRVDVLRGVGGFDETYRKMSNGEDIDLAWRAKEGGARSAFADDALVYHDVSPSNFKAYWREIRRRPTLVKALKDHPGARRQLQKGLFFRPSHPWALAVLACGILLLFDLTAWWRWLVAAGVGLGYAWQCRRARTKPRHTWQWLGVVPAALVAELYEIAVMARASLRYRTVLL